MTAAIEVRGLTKSFAGKRKLRRFWKKPEPLRALRGIDLDVRPGELVTLIGPNGAGKTTLLKIVATLIGPTSGHARVLGRDVIADARSCRGQIGYVLTEERSFYWRLSVQDNLRFFAALQNLHGKAANRRIEELAALLGLTDQLEREFADLSAGQKQRAAIARGLLADPPVLLFDEATRSLDPGRAERTRRVIREILVERKNKAVLFATHDLSEAEALSDRCAVMADGKLACSGTWSEVADAAHSLFEAEAAEEDAVYQGMFGEKMFGADA